MSPYRKPGERAPRLEGFRVTWWAKAWVRWARRPFYNRSRQAFVCARCGCTAPSLGAAWAENRAIETFRLFDALRFVTLYGVECWRLKSHDFTHKA